MIVHKKDRKCGEAICGADDYKTAIISYMWLQVNCKQCLTEKDHKRLRNRIQYHKNKIARLEKEYEEKGY